MVQPDNNQSNMRLNNGTTVRQQYRPNQGIANNNSNNISNNTVLFLDLNIEIKCENLLIGVIKSRQKIKIENQ